MNEITFSFDKVIKNHEEYDDLTGPLDMILLLLSRDKIEIQDISLTVLVEQYLAVLARWEELDMEIATEFTVMASHLVYLKTRMLLKVGEQRDEEVDSLLLALQKRQRQDQYNGIKWASDWLAEHSFGFAYVTKQPSPFTDKSYKQSHDIDFLQAAYQSLLTRLTHIDTPMLEAFTGIVGREHHPIEPEMESILHRVQTSKRLLFNDLLRECQTNSQRVAVFLAVLSLCKDCKLVPQDSDKGLTLTAA